MTVAYKDDGEDWNTVEFLREGESIENEDCLLSIDDGKTLFVATSAGRIYRSTDKAKSWQVAEDGVFFHTPYIAILKSFDKIYAVNQSGIVCSGNNGNTWNYMDNPILEHKMNDKKIELIPIPAEVLALLHRILDQNNEILKINTRLLEELMPPGPIVQRPPNEEILKKFGAWR